MKQRLALNIFVCVRYACTYSASDVAGKYSPAAGGKLQFNLINLPNILHVLFNGTVGGELTDIGNI